MGNPGELPIFCLESNYGSVKHWERLVRNARDLGVTRLVWLWYNGNIQMPNLYKWLPEFHAAWDWEKEGVIELRRNLVSAGEMTRKAGMEFFLWYPVLHFRLSDLKRLPKLLPELFNGKDVPDVNGPFFSYFIEEQLRETFREFPFVDGIALWMCENSEYDPLTLAKNAPLPKVLDTCVDAICKVCLEEKRTMVADIHSASGTAAVTREMIRSYARYPEVVVQTDATWGDYSLTCPTSVFIPEIAKNNRVMVNFDCYGEYFGRNTVPTIYLNWVKTHWENACAMAGGKLVGIDGRVSTAHDNHWPHYEVLPRLMKEFPFIPQNRHHRAIMKDGKPIYAELSCFETLSKVHAAALKTLREHQTLEPIEVIEAMCEEEFGKETAAELAALLAQIEPILVSIYTVNKQYFGGQSVLPGFGSWILDAHCFYDLFQEPGSDFPNPKTLQDGKFHAPFDGDWPVPKGLRTISFQEMSAAIEQGAKKAQSLLESFQRIKPRLRIADADFLERQFTLLERTAAVRYHLFRGIYYHYRLTQQNDGEEALENLAQCTRELAKATDALELLVGPEDRTTVKPAREWLVAFAGRLSSAQKGDQMI